MSEQNTQASIKHIPFSLDYGNGEMIKGDLKFSKSNENGPLPLVIICHGFKGFKDWGFFPTLGNHLAESGFASIVFNFSLNGIGDNPYDFDRLDNFQRNTFSREHDELEFLIDAIKKKTIPEFAALDTENITLVGHSRGGAAVVTVASRREEVRALITLAAIDNIKRFNDEIEQKWREDGVYHVLNGRTGQQMPLGLELLEDILSDPDRIEKAARSLSSRTLVVHGTEDPAVDITAAHNLQQWINNSESLLIQGADHVFGACHPFAGVTEDLETVFTAMVEFITTTKPSP